ncbi:MAG: glycosyltransferase [Planctomycetota bacterium]|nr:glycosyltransferase [Planctomycetota bacterium]
MKRILLTGGATGGHLFPGVALARALAEYEIATPVFLEHGKAMEKRVLEDTGIERVSAPWGEQGGRISAFTRIPAACRLLKKERIDAVVALGALPGFAPGMAARFQGKPLFVLEQNRVIGLANRVLSLVARKVFLSFPLEKSSRSLRSRSAVLGCPLRSGFKPAPLPQGDRAQVLIFGGSQGSSDINKLLLEAAGHFHRPVRFQVHHVCGPQKEHGICAESPSCRFHMRQAWKEAGVEARVSTFLDDPAQEMARATLVLGRAGGSTIAELTAVGRPALLWPYPHHRDEHQKKNARYLEQMRAATVVTTEDSRQIAGDIENLLRDTRKLEEMADCSRALGHPDAAYRIAEMIAVHLGVKVATISGESTGTSTRNEEVMA